MGKASLIVAKYIIIPILVLTGPVYICHSVNSESRVVSHPDFQPVINKLLENGADTSFVEFLVSNPLSKFNPKFVKINVTGYLKKPDYSSNYSAYSVKKSKRFLINNYDLLTQCEKIFDVPKEIITAVIWVETKFGAYLGKSHIPSVFLSTAMANLPENIKINKDELKKKFKGKKNALPELEKKIEARAIKKANWAFNELLALEKIYKNSHFVIHDIKGSWAGAFGYSQFLPSSYVNWAVDGNRDSIIDLFDMEDAVFSVANYLKTNGWGESEKEMNAALFHYNNSKDYVNAIRRLASKLTIKPLRIPLSKQLLSEK